MEKFLVLISPLPFKSPLNYDDDNQFHPKDDSLENDTIILKIVKKNHENSMLTRQRFYVMINTPVYNDNKSCVFRKLNLIFF